MRNPANWQVYAQGSQPTMPYGGRGYTGHEHLNQFGIINMNARLYDPLLARFLAPDPYVGSGMTGDFNRYIYAKNNPMMYTDPDGKFAWLAFLAGTLIYQGISYLSGVRDTGWKDWTPRLSTVIGGGYSGSNGYYGGISVDGGIHFTNLGWKDGLTAGTTNGGVTQMNSVAQNGDPTSIQMNKAKQAYMQDDKLFTSFKNSYQAILAIIPASLRTVTMADLSVSAIEVSAALVTTAEVVAFGGCLLLQGDTEDHSYLDKDEYIESTGYPFKEQNRYQNEMKNQDQQPPKGLWWLIIGGGVWSLYDNWPKPNVPIPTKIVQPIFQQLPMTPYDQYFLKLK